MVVMSMVIMSIKDIYRQSKATPQEGVQGVLYYTKPTTVGGFAVTLVKIFKF
jgi:hypothetical protein